ncbi:MAG TPA: dihydrolipoamide succinyltransferase, partial [Aliiroseovarius sp.]|nr:dihydrolipoamide succinyltransferase [Aliiroseovarius sp.]
MTTEVKVPALGESVTEATIATWFKKPGDRVEVDEMLCELETDKVTVEVPAPVAGTLAEIVAPEGTTVGVGALLATIEEGAAEAPADKPAATAAPAAAQASAPAPASAAPAATGGQVDVVVPALGESVTEATVGAWYKQVGDAVTVDEMLAELETDKVSVEVPAPASGVIAEILASEGSTVEPGARLAVISASGEATAAAPAATTAGPAPTADVEDAPAAKKAMAEAGLTRDQVTGTGRDGRVMKEDVQAAVAAASAAPAAAAPAPA